MLFEKDYENMVVLQKGETPTPLATPLIYVRLLAPYCDVGRAGLAETRLWKQQMFAYRGQRMLDFLKICVF